MTHPFDLEPPEGDLRPAWEWEDGWKMLRLARRTHDAYQLGHRSSPGTSLLQRYFGDATGASAVVRYFSSMRVRVEHCRMVVLDEQGEPTSMIRFASFEWGQVSDGLPTLCVRDCRTTRGWEVLRHFVSMVEQLSAQVPCQLSPRFTSDLQACSSWLGPHPDLRCHFTTLLRHEATPPDVFLAFAPLRVPGRCSDPEAELALLLGNLPEVFLYSKEDP